MKSVRAVESLMSAHERMLFPPTR